MPQLQSASHVPTQAEKEAAMEEMKTRKEALQNASEERKNFMQTMELKRKENAKPSDLEQVKWLLFIEWKPFSNLVRQFVGHASSPLHKL